ncbi:MAG: site-specific DNA-methyltransferase, partial [Phototrophicales bacterium]|nr:site-specific DNA-methyltransferase [Phototrophicales bacterium]
MTIAPKTRILFIDDIVGEFTMASSEIKKYLGNPFYEAPDCLIYCGDCLELMPLLPPNCLDLTVTSPPYNIGKEYEQSLSLESYIEWCFSWIHEIYRLTKSDGAFWLNLGYTPNHPQAKALPLPYLLWDKNPFFLIQEIIWHYGAGVAGRKFFSPRNEKFLWY